VLKPRRKYTVFLSQVPFSLSPHVTEVSASSVIKRRWGKRKMELSSQSHCELGIAAGGEGSAPGEIKSK